MIHIDGLTKDFDGITAVNDVSMTLQTGTITVIVGTSGSGKSTLLRMINRLIEPTAGRVMIDGTDTRNITPHELRRRIGYVIQSHGLFPHWTVAQNIATVPKLLGWADAQISERINELLDLLQLDPSEIAGRYPHQLSGGQSQRVGVARALAARPTMLLMDEPFGALDPVIRTKAQSDLKDIQTKLGATILLVTHDMTEAIRLGDQIAVMNEGRIEQLAPPQDILAKPDTDFVRDLVGGEERPFHYLSLIPVAKHMTSGVASGDSISQQHSLLDALATMIWTGRDALPVHNESGQISGCITREALLAAGGP
jgi:osmoprotectant transport system ATP-binding protein